MTDIDFRALERTADPRARAWAFRLGILPLQDIAVGDVVEVGSSVGFDGLVISTSWVGQPCPVRVLIIGFRPWKRQPGSSPIVLGFPPFRDIPHVAARDRITRILQVGLL